MVMSAQRRKCSVLGSNQFRRRKGDPSQGADELRRVLNRMGKVDVSRAFSSPENKTPVTYSYDSVGNCLAEGSSRHFGRDYAGRMRVFRIQASDTSEHSQYVHYLYDPSGRRVKKINRLQTGANWDVAVYIDGIFEQRWQVRGASTKKGQVLHLMDGQKRIGRRRTGETVDSKPDNLLVVVDHLESANLELDWSLGDLVDREEFRPYGETSFGSYGLKRYRFTGKERDEESGLYYHGVRYRGHYERPLAMEYVATAAASSVVMAAACLRGGDAGRVCAGWLTGCYFLLSVAELLLSPLGLSLLTRLGFHRKSLTSLTLPTESAAPPAAASRGP